MECLFLFYRCRLPAWQGKGSSSYGVAFLNMQYEENLKYFYTLMAHFNVARRLEIYSLQLNDIVFTSHFYLILQY